MSKSSQKWLLQRHFKSQGSILCTICMATCIFTEINIFNILYNILKTISVQNTQYTIIYSVTVGNSDPCLWSHLPEHSLAA